MRKTTVKSMLLVAVTSAIVLSARFAASTQDSGKAGSAHGGIAAKTKRHDFEAVFTKGGIRLYVNGADDRPVDVSRLTASATFFHPNSEKPWFTRQLRPAAASTGLAAGSLELVLNLSRVPVTGAKVAFQVAGLSDPGEPRATFTVPFTLADASSITVGKVTKADEKAIAAQKICPVSGEELGGEMGPPVKITRGGRSIFLCCKNCLKKIEADPDKYFGLASQSSKDRH
jgi:hypothetical protein